MSIANGSGAAVRADINLALQALASNSSGSTAPSTTYAYQLWVDTSGASPILKIRNAANSGWITLGPVDALNFGFRPTLAQSADPAATAIAFQFWVDTGSNTLKMRNAAASAWITIGDATQANFALLPLTGGTLSGFLSSSNTDYWKMPVGTTGQRPGSPAVGMIRYNSSLTCYEVYLGSAWVPIGGGGGGGSLQWYEGENAPTGALDAANNRVYAFVSGLSQKLFTSIKVPHGYVAGSQIKLYLPFYSPDSSNTALLTTVATLIRSATTVFSATTNQRTSTNSAITLSGATTNIPQMVSFDLTSSTGTINGQAVAADDVINISLTRGSDSATSDLQVQPFSAEVTFQ
jgi:hypothetical protein